MAPHRNDCSDFAHDPGLVVHGAWAAFLARRALLVVCAPGWGMCCRPHPRLGKVYPHAAEAR